MGRTSLTKGYLKQRRELLAGHTTPAYEVLRKVVHAHGRKKKRRGGGDKRKTKQLVGQSTELQDLVLAPLSPDDNNSKGVGVRRRPAHESILEQMNNANKLIAIEEGEQGFEESINIMRHAKQRINSGRKIAAPPRKRHSISASSQSHGGTYRVRNMLVKVMLRWQNRALDSSRRAMSGAWLTWTDHTQIMRRSCGAADTVAARKALLMDPSGLCRSHDSVKMIMKWFEFADVFPNLPDHHVHTLSQRGKFFVHKPGDVIFLQGMVGDVYHIVFAGSVDLFSLADTSESARLVSEYSQDPGFFEQRSDEDVRALLGSKVHTVQAKRGFGELALLKPDGQRSTAAVAGHGGADIMQIPLEVYRSSLRQFHEEQFSHDVSDKIQFFQSIREFRGWDKAPLTAMTYNIPLNRHSRGFKIIDPTSAEADALFFIKSGECKLIKNGLSIALLQPGQMFGEEALVEGKRRHRYGVVVGSSTAEIYRMDRYEDFNKLILGKNNPAATRTVAIMRENAQVKRRWFRRQRRRMERNTRRQQELFPRLRRGDRQDRHLLPLLPNSATGANNLPAMARHDEEETEAEESSIAVQVGRRCGAVYRSSIGHTPYEDVSRNPMLRPSSRGLTVRLSEAGSGGAQKTSSPVFGTIPTVKRQSLGSRCGYRFKFQQRIIDGRDGQEQHTATLNT